MNVATGFTAVRMKKIEDETVVSGHVNQATKELFLTTRAGVAINAGNVEGPQGIQGIQGPPGLIGGSIAQRDSYFGSTTTVAQQVALANAMATWHNATLGYIETYYAKTGSAGLLVPGNPVASGWYPIPYYEKYKEVTWAEFTGPIVNSGAGAGVNFGLMTLNNPSGTTFVTDFVQSNGPTGLKILKTGVYAFVAVAMPSSSGGTCHLWGTRTGSIVDDPMSRNHVSYGSNKITDTEMVFCKANDILNFGITTYNQCNLGSSVKVGKIM